MLIFHWTIICFRIACNQLGLGISALFGPANSYLASHVHSMCDALDLPHIESRLDLETEPKRLSINLYPKQSLLNQAYSDVISFLNWTKMAIIYEHDYGKSVFTYSIKCLITIRMYVIRKFCNWVDIYELYTIYQYNKYNIITSRIKTLKNDV